MTAEPHRAVDRAVWDDLVDDVRSLGDLVFTAELSDDPAGRAVGVRYLLRFLAAGISACIEYDDVSHPEIGRIIESRMAWGLDNPDCNYGFARVSGDRSYRIHGTLGSAARLELQVNTGHFGDGNFAGWRSVSAISSDDLEVDDDGTVEITLSSDSRDRNWMQLDDEAGFLLVRQYFGDWETEEPAELVIEAIDAELPPAPLDEPTMADRIALLSQWVTTAATTWADFSAGIRTAAPGPVQPFVPPASAAGLKGQAYGMGAWRCDPGDAVILELDPPDSLLWSLSLCDEFWESIDFANRQSSLNSHQAEVDADGRVRFVISHDDPGVPNWLDPGGRAGGTLAVRYLLASSLPAVDYRTVARSELADALPRSTPHVTAEERQHALATRRLSVQRRYRR
jgi:hypothetical protein